MESGSARWSSEPPEFEPLTGDPWDPARIVGAIATIVADADAAFDPDALWPAHQWDGWQAPLQLKNLYVGAAGVLWALDALRRRGHAGTSLDLAAAALRTLPEEHGASLRDGRLLHARESPRASDRARADGRRRRTR